MSVESIVTEYGDMLFRICLVMLCNEQDAQDAVQDTLCRYMEHAPTFHGVEHEKAWQSSTLYISIIRFGKTRARMLCM